MGYDATYQAVPHDGHVMRRVAADPEAAECLCLLPLWFRGCGTAHLSGGPGEGLWQAALLDADAHPGLPMRRFDGARWYDMLHFLLSENRRRGSAEMAARDWAVRGRAEIAPAAVGVQGIPVRYVEPEEVRAITASLETVTEAELRLPFVPDHVEAAGIYKFGARDVTAETWRLLWSYFEHFRSFYRQVAQHGEGVLVIID